MKKINDFCNDYFKTIKKCSLIKVLICFFIAFGCIGTIAMSNNSKTISKIDISYELVNNSKPAIVDKIIINNSEYTGIKELDEKYDVDEKEYVFDNNKISFNISKNDDFSIVFEDNNIENLVIKVDDKNLNINHFKSEDDNIISTLSASYNVNTLNIVKNQINEIGLIKVLLILLLSFMISYLLICLINKFINDIFNKKFSIIEFIATIYSLFTIYYFTFFFYVALASIVVLFPLLIILGLIIYKNKNNIQFKIENIFVIISLFLGMTMLFAIPPFNVPDEGSHFGKVYDHLFYLEKDNTFYDEYGYTYTYLSKNMKQFNDEYMDNTLNYEYHTNTKSYFKYYFKSIDKSEQADDYIWYGTYRSNKLAYIPANISIFLSKTLNFSPILLFLLARLANLICYILLVYLSLKILPKFKPIFFIIGTFPIAFHQAMGIGQDCLNIAFAFLLCAYIFKKVYDNQNIKTRDFIIIGLLSICLAFCKIIYTPLILLVFLINNNKFENKMKAYLFKFGIAFLAIAASGFTYYLVAYYNVGTFTPLDADSIRRTYPYSYLFSNPIDTAKIFARTLSSRFSLDIFRGFFDGFGWSTVWSKDIILYACMIPYALLIFSTPDDLKGEKKNRVVLTKILMCFIFVSLMGIIAASMFFGWTIYGSASIDGLQPRYYIPIIPLLYIFISNKYFKINVKNYDLFLALSIVILNILCFATILYGFYF